MAEHRQPTGVSPPPVLRLPSADWRAVDAIGELERLLATRIGSRRWFGSKTRAIKSTCILDSFAIVAESRLALVEVRFDEGPSEVYQLNLAVEFGPRAEQLLSEQPAAVWARLEVDGDDRTAVLYEPLADEAFCGELLCMIESQRSVSVESGQLVAWQSEAFPQARGDDGMVLRPRVSRAEQSNTSIVYGDRLILKLFRRLETGTNPDLELSAHLTRRGFGHTPPLAGAIEYRRAADEPWAVAELLQFVPNRGDAWEYALSALAPVLAVTRGAAMDAAIVDRMSARLVEAAKETPPGSLESVLGAFIHDAERLGTRTAEMHLALAAYDDDGSDNFVPEPLSLGQQQQMANRTRSMVDETFDLLRRQVQLLSGNALRLADDVLDRRPRAFAEIKQFAAQPIEVDLIRCHGDYHLGQVLVTTEGDFMIIDFEGEPARPLAERRDKQLALRDVAGMIRSFHYASCAAATQAKKAAPPADAQAIEAKAAAWYFWTSVAFLRTYRQAAGAAAFVPRSDDDFQRMLDMWLLEKAVYELRYELNNRPDWVYLPLTALCDLLGAGSGTFFGQ